MRLREGNRIVNFSTVAKNDSEPDAGAEKNAEPAEQEQTEPMK